ncbi:MAG: YbaN family protein [Clostridium sp.]
MIKITKFIYLTIGFISMAIGAIGVFIPVMPTTPFLLLASFCFGKGSDKFNNWFKETKLYKKHLESFVRERAMTLKQKIYILALADFMIGIPLILVDNLLVKGMLICVIVIKLYYFIFKIRTIKLITIKEE